MKPLSMNNSEHSVSITIEEMSRQTCMSIPEIKAAIKQLEDRGLVTVVRHPFSISRYIINLDEIERLAKQSQSREV
ncbi:hypothetical protein O4H50_10980 [Vibrio diazotrophicus]|uniref:hypothetical protein n=1 Tax=Vibrio diazotrophicus TaxID=685 RepID=UPI0022B0431F|nr:hypothetical protein [Vibrio diazotrophicus]MCZ4372316.1 hypothetical protein [Vibrio diazotrophicus]